MELFLGIGQFFGDMPGNGLAFPVRVGGQINALRFLGRLSQVFQDLVFPGDDLEFRFEIMFDIHSQQIGGQVLHVSQGGLDLELRRLNIFLWSAPWSGIPRSVTIFPFPRSYPFSKNLPGNCLIQPLISISSN